MLVGKSSANFTPASEGIIGCRVTHCWLCCQVCITALFILTLIWYWTDVEVPNNGWMEKHRFLSSCLGWPPTGHLLVLRFCSSVRTIPFWSHNIRHSKEDYGLGLFPSMVSVISKDMHGRFYWFPSCCINIVFPQLNEHQIIRGAWKKVLDQC